jgi:hypothetical protein
LKLDWLGYRYTKPAQLTVLHVGFSILLVPTQWVSFKNGLIERFFPLTSGHLLAINVWMTENQIGGRLSPPKLALDVLPALETKELATLGSSLPQ